MRKIIIILSPNTTVTANNFKIIADAGKKTNNQVVEVHSCEQARTIGNKTDVFVTSTANDVINLKGHGFNRILFWVQGIIPEESYMRHKSRLRSGFLSWKEKRALKRARLCAFVSEPMREHYEKKYSLDFKGNYYIFPCFNTQIVSEAFDYEAKYKNNYFVYAGGLAIWQCFGKTLNIYKEVEKWGLPNTKLIVLTKDQERARKCIDDCGIQNFEIDFTTPDDLPNILKKAKFGFVIREDSPVNRVATPTKISTYLSCGLIPIFGKSVETFRRLSNQMTYKVVWDDTEGAYDIIRSFMNMEINPSKVKEEYNQFFEENYSYERHVAAISIIMQKLMEE